MAAGPPRAGRRGVARGADEEGAVTVLQAENSEVPDDVLGSTGSPWRWR